MQFLYNIYSLSVGLLFNAFEISGNISKRLEVLTSIILFKFADIPRSRATNKLFLLNTMHKVKHKDLKSCLSKTCLFYSVTLQCWTWKQLIDIDN